MTEVVTRERLFRPGRANHRWRAGTAIAELSSRLAIGLARASAAVYSNLALVNAVPRVRGRNFA